MAGRAGKGSTFKIEPFKHPIAMDPNYADKTWRVLESAITEIHNQNASGLSFEELYRNAYNMVLHKYGDRLYAGVAGALASHLDLVAARVEKANGAPFLRELVVAWGEHNKSTQMIRDILMYMDRTYVMQQHKTPVFQLGLDLWRDRVVRHREIRARLLHQLKEMVGKERAGDLVERSLLKDISQMLMDLGKPTYQEDFEAHFLADAAEFYRKEAQAWIASCSAPEYLRKADARLAEECDRVKAYLDESTDPKITRVVEVELIQQQMRVLAEMEGSGLLVLLADDRYEDLGRMYGLFRRVEGGAELLRCMMGRAVEEEGRAAVTDPDKLKDAVGYVTTLLAMRDKYEAIIVRAFGDDKSFKNTLNSSFEVFLNSQARSPEFISLFIDNKLRTGGKGAAAAVASEADLDVLLDKVMGLFRYLADKDVFERYYKQHLAKRLLAAKTVSDDLERNMLVKLKTECGYTFTSKLESMFTDIKTSRDTMGDFLEKCRQNNVQLPIDVTVQVLTTGSWPTQAACSCQLPPEMQQACAAFQQFYTDAHGGRKLTWQTNMGNAEVRYHTDKRYDLTVSTYQAAILMLFNGPQERLAYRDIAAATEIPPPDLRRALQSLALIKGKAVLRKEPQGKDIEEGDVFSPNPAFTSKTIKVKLVTISAQKEDVEEKQETRQKVEADRNPQIDAAVVRYMKSRKQANHNEVVTEVTKQLAPRFLPNPLVIKKRIETLIEREFLERDAEDRKVYKYLA